jgi:2-(3-amino-3-carboxypropyl)histidine synthase
MEPTEGIETPAKPLPSKSRRRFVGTSTSKAGAGAGSSKTPVRRVANLIPDDILHDPELNDAIAGTCVVSRRKLLLAPCHCFSFVISGCKFLAGVERRFED